MSAISSPTLVDRAAEQRRLRSAWDAAESGQPRLMLLAGEAGIGKSRLLREFGHDVTRRGGRSLTGACLQLGETALPFLPITEIVRRLARTDDAEVQAAIDPARAELAALVPTLTGRAAPTSDDGATGDPRLTARRPDLSESAARSRLFEAILGLVERLAVRQPLLVGLEDVHWSDPATRDLVTFLVHNLASERLLLVLTLRTDGLPRTDPVVPWIAELLRTTAAERIDMERLPREEVARQVEAITGLPLDGPSLHRLWERSEGNPFFVEELLAAGEDGPASRRGGVGDESPGDDGGSAPSRVWRDAIPRTLAEVLLARVAVLSEAARSVVRVVAVAGVPVDDARLEAALAIDRTDLRMALREPIDGGLLRVDEQGRVRPRHALLGEVVEGSLLAGERRRLHEALAAAFEVALPAGSEDAASIAAARARHWLAADRPAEAYRAALDAAGAASAIYAHEEASRHLRAALDLDRRMPEPLSRAGRVALLLQAVDTLDLAGDDALAIELAGEALALADGVADPVTAGTIHSKLGYLRWVGGEGEASLAEHRQAVALVPSEPASPERAQVLGALGGALMGAGRYAESRLVCAEAVRVAEAARAVTQESRARNMLGSDLVALGEVDAGLAELRRARRLAELDAPLDMLVVAHHNLALNLLLADHRAEAVVEALAGRDLARRLGLERRYAPYLVGVAADALFRSGQWADAAVIADQTLAAVSGSRSVLYLVIVRARLHAARGEASRAADRLDEAARLAGSGSDPDLEAYLSLARAEAALLVGLPAEAAAAARAGLRALEGTDDPGSAVPLLAVAAEAIAELAADATASRDTDLRGQLAHDAAGCASDAAALAGVHATPSLRALAGRAQAEAARAAGDAAVDPWVAAVAAADEAGLPLPAAEARLRLAEILLRSRAERQRGEAVLRAGLEAATQLGAAPLAARLRELARRARVDTEAATPPDAETGRSEAPPRPATTLSDRELEVLRLIAEGRSNGQIADALFITRKTASSHVTHILDKLGVASRLEAAMTASRLGLLPPSDDPGA